MVHVRQCVRLVNATAKCYWNPSGGFLQCAGAKALCCSAHAEVKEMMSSAPRWAVHQALAERTPATYAARQAPAQQLGISPDMEDSAIAYRLLLEVRLIPLGWLAVLARSQRCSV